MYQQAETAKIAVAVLKLLQGESDPHSSLYTPHVPITMVRVQFILFELMSKNSLCRPTEPYPRSCPH